MCASTSTLPRPLGVENCLAYMKTYVKKHSLLPIFGKDLKEGELDDILRPHAEVASQLPFKLDNIRKELLMRFTVMSLYDLVVLIDDSFPVEPHECRIRKVALKKLLCFMAKIYGAVSGGSRGIRAIRFFNGIDSANNVIQGDEIEEIVDCYESEGRTHIDAALEQQILKPFVYADDPSWVKGTPKKMRDMKRLLLIMVIISAEGEPEGSVEKDIQATVDSLQAAGIGHKAVVFQFAQVGNDKGAEEYLRKLGGESLVADYVHIIRGSDLTEVLDGWPE